MSPSDLRMTAAFLRERHRPPHPGLPIGEGMVSSSIYALSDALERTADEADARPIASPQTADDAMLRHTALDLAIRSLRGDEENEEIGARAEAFLRFLRGEAAQP